MDFKFSEPNSLREKKEEKLTVVFSGSYEDSEENSEITVEEGIEEICENAFRDLRRFSPTIGDTERRTRLGRPCRMASIF